MSVKVSQMTGWCVSDVKEKSRTNIQHFEGFFLIRDVPKPSELCVSADTEDQFSSSVLKINKYTLLFFNMIAWLNYVRLDRCTDLHIYHLGCIGGISDKDLGIRATLNVRKAR